jgi:flagellar biosynthetic protein FliR
MHASPHLEYSTLAAFLLVLARLGSMLAFVPIPGARSAAEPARVFLVLALCVAMHPVWPRIPATDIAGGTMLLWIAGECLFGTAVGVLVGFLSESLVFGAQAVALQAGFSYASTIDPGSQADSTVLQTAAQLSANLFFFAASADSLILRAFGRSLEIMPPGSVSVGILDGLGVIGFGSEMLALGARLALPVAGLLLLTDITLALVGRLQAQLQLLSLAFPVKMLGALFLLASLARLSWFIYRSALPRLTVALEGLVR